MKGSDRNKRMRKSFRRRAMDPDRGRSEKMASDGGIPTGATRNPGLSEGICPCTLRVAHLPKASVDRSAEPIEMRMPIAVIVRIGPRCFGRIRVIGGKVVQVRRTDVRSNGIVMFMRMIVRVAMWLVMPISHGGSGHIDRPFAASFMRVWGEPVGMRMIQFERRQNGREQPCKQQNRYVRLVLAHRSFLCRKSLFNLCMHRNEASLRLQAAETIASWAWSHKNLSDEALIRANRMVGIGL